MELVNKVEQPTTVKDFVNDPKCIAIALESSRQLQNIISKNWFTALQVRDRFQIGFEEAIQKLEALKLFGFIYERQQDNKDKEYKVILNNQQRLNLVEGDITFYLQKVEILKKEVIKLNEKIENEQKSK